MPDAYGPIDKQKQFDNEVKEKILREYADRKLKEQAAYHKSILLEADSLVGGERSEDYGPPLDDFTCTAELWTAFLQRSGLLPKHKRISAMEIPVMMILLKVSRQANAHKRDNLVDIAGYAETLQMAIDEEDCRPDKEQTFSKLIADHDVGVCSD